MKIIKTSLAILALSLAFASCENKETKKEKTNFSQTEIKQESEKLNNFFTKVTEERIENSPMMLTRLGRKGDHGKWDDISMKAKAEELELSKKYLQWLQDSISVNALDKKTKLSYDLFKQRLVNDTVDYKYRLYDYPLNQMHGMQAEIPAFLINMHQVSDVKDVKDYIKRLKNIEPLFDQLIANLKASHEAGVQIPKFVFEKVIRDSKNVITGKPFTSDSKNSVLYEDFMSKLNSIEGLTEEDKKPFIKEANKGFENVRNAYTKLIDFMQHEEQRATTDDGVWKFPNGQEYYANALKRTTTTDLSAKEIHDIGLKEVERIHKEMKAIKEQVGFKGTLKEFFKFMKNDPQFYYPETKKGKEEYVAEATQIINTMKGRLDELFITKPKADLITKPVEAFREKSAGKAFYQRGSMDGKRPGTYYANTYDMKSMPSYQMEALAYHEGIPGHHMQISIAQELDGIPMFRKLGGYTAYVEGWALYCENIPKELGFYKDPYSDFGRLAMELWRACRLVVDTGIHEMKWTREQGIEFYENNTPNSSADCIKMVDRHIVMPSQATAYKIGMLKIMELREKAKTQLADKFDIREFHEVVLSNGPVPLNILEDLVDEYIQGKK
ncbi:DUF885 domain-containing protein [Aureivirga sp. CE67]|uniref:DUF885 domain-containing protein n=1 Tax=Aureivirga sp. CE67 TaxID=1788983 RepID=UPI0018CB3A47|nr:DUF885 domain-containing protein [Aureivirga sp. CE67]